MRVPRYAWSLCKIAAKESTRYAINGINFYVKKGKGYAVVTDGRRVAEFSWPIDEDEVFAVATLPREACIAARALKSDVELTSRDGRLVISVGDEVAHTVSTAASDGKFPNVNEVIPKYQDDDANTIGVDPILLAELLMAVDTLSPELVKLVVPNDPKKPILIQARGDSGSATAVLMPVKLDR